MKAYVIAYINFFDNTLHQARAEGNTWKEAYKDGMNKIFSDLRKDRKVTDDDLNLMSDDMNEAINDAFNSDYLFDLIEL